MNPAAFAAPRAVLAQAIAARAFPAAVVEVGRRETVVWREAFGALTWAADAAATSPETVFDLASLSKVIATATVAMRLVDAGALRLHDPVGRWVREWRGADRDDVRVVDLLEHASGLTAWLPLFRDYSTRSEYQHAIATLPLEYRPRSQSIYSDLGFMLLGFILEDAVGESLDGQFGAVAAGLSAEIRYRPPRDWRPRTAPTEIDPWRGRLLCGEVHDENAFVLGGVAGHAGLFGTAAAVGQFARAVLQTLAGAPRLASPETMRRFATPTRVASSSRALGWDTMLPTSSCGRRMSAAAIGHTGFTGTSLWVDRERDVYVVLLTNRVHPSRDNEQILAVRPALHDAVMEALDA